MRKIGVLSIVLFFMLAFSVSVIADCTDKDTVIGRDLLEVFDIDVGDLDNDGNIDIVGASGINGGDNDINIFFGNGAGSFPSSINISTISFSSQDQQVNIVDFDNDGDNDVIATVATDIFTFTNDGTGNFIQNIVIPSQSWDLAADDFNGDGNSDIVLARGASAATLDVYFGDGDGTFDNAWNITIDLFLTDINSIDIDNDGDIDLIGCSEDADYMHLYENDGSGFFNKREITTGVIAPRECLAADMDNDGDIDIVTAGNFLQIWLNDGFETFTLLNVTPVNDMYDFDLKDIDLDGDIDIISFNSVLNVLQYWEQQGTLNFIETNISTGIDGLGITKGFDLSNDGLLDFVFSDSNTAELNYINNNQCEDIQAISPIQDCGADHIIFCDEFNYGVSLRTRDWFIFQGINHNATFAPVDNKLRYEGLNRFQAEHSLNAIDVNYEVGLADTITFSNEHPVVSHEFKINITDNSSVVDYQVFNSEFLPSIFLSFEDDDVFFWNISIDDFTMICENCVNANVSHDVKIIQRFGLDTAGQLAGRLNFYPFNISVNQSNYDVWIDNVQVGNNLLFMDFRSHIARVIFLIRRSPFFDGDGEELKRKIEIDDIFVYKGTSKIDDNSETFFVQLFDAALLPPRTLGQICTLPDNCADGLKCVKKVNALDSFCVLIDETITDPDDNAIKNAFRAIPTGGLGFDLIWYLIMFIVGITVFMTAAKTTNGTVALGGTLLVEIFLLIVGTLLGFIPAFIVITIVVIGLGIAGLFLRKILTGSAN